MARIRLIHWNAEEAQKRARRLEALGYLVDWTSPQGRSFLRELTDRPPDAVVIDLSRLPSQGRDMGVLIRQRKSTRDIPLVFVAGDAEKVARVRGLLPDATYADWEEVGKAIASAISEQPDEPVSPSSAFAAYSGTPLLKKLGIVADMTVGLVEAPPGFLRTLGDLPEGVALKREALDGCDLLIWFVRSTQDLVAMADMIDTMGRSRMWIAWPKKASGVVSDLSQQIVRDAGLAAGLVDYKVCSIDATWSGLLFTKRKRE